VPTPLTEKTTYHAASTTKITIVKVALYHLLLISIF